MGKTTSVAISAGIDHVRLARMLRRAHTIALDTGVPPPVVRSLVSDSWRRCIDGGVDPTRPAPRKLDARGTARCLASHPIADVLPRIRALLEETMLDSEYFVAFSDAEGVLLWSDGPTRALEAAVAPRFLPGFICSEEQVGTNAIGTALAVKQPVQIFSAEHFNQMLHGWTCAAAPVHDPHTGDLLGVIDLSGGFRTGHGHSLGLICAVARAAEAWLAVDRAQADERLRSLYQARWGRDRRRPSALVSRSGRVLLSHPPGWLPATVDVTLGPARCPQADATTIEVEPFEAGFVVWRPGAFRRARPPRVTATLLGRRLALVAIGGRTIQLRARHSEIVALLAVQPSGMNVRDLARSLYGSPHHEATVRAEITRLRSLLGESLRSRPYRLDERVQVDITRVERSLAEGDLDAARRAYAGPLLPGSTAPGVVAARARLAGALNRHTAPIAAEPPGPVT